MSRLLIVEDDVDVRYALVRALTDRIGSVLEASTMTEALAILHETSVEIVLLDLGLPDSSGITLITEILQIDPVCRIVVLTGRDDARVAVQALKAGAVDYLTKPFERAALFDSLERAFETGTIRRSVQEARQKLKTKGIVGKSPAWIRALEEAKAAAQYTRASVLLSGQSGTGKEEVAHLIHTWSPRKSGPFIAVNAACLPVQLLESELFGHEAGAFTDARASRKGLFEMAHRGTLFIDEIGDLQLELQPKLLRVLEGRTFRRIGGSQEILTDVRVISATNRDLSSMVAAGTFREDLFFRIRVLPISLPSLSTRAGDIRELACYFVAAIGTELGHPNALLTPRVLSALEVYPWPGNVRELRNVIERALVLSDGGDIDVHHLPSEIRGRHVEGAAKGGEHKSGVIMRAKESLGDNVRNHILACYEATGRNITQTAKILDITRVSLRRHLKKYGAFKTSA